MIRPLAVLGAAVVVGAAALSGCGNFFMIVAGLRFDTSGRGREGTRSQANARGAGGFAIRRVPGL